MAANVYPRTHSINVFVANMTAVDTIVISANNNNGRGIKFGAKESRTREHTLSDIATAVNSIAHNCVSFKIKHCANGVYTHTHTRSSPHITIIEMVVIRTAHI